MNLRKLETAKFLEYSKEIEKVKSALIEEGFESTGEYQVEFKSVLGFKVKVSLGIFSTVQYAVMDEESELLYNDEEKFTYPLDEIEDETIAMVKGLIDGNTPSECFVC